MSRKWKKLIFIAPLAIVAMLLFIVIGGEIVMRLWNWLLPPLFGWRQITFLQAFGILALCRILFGGHGWHRSGRYNFRRRGIADRVADRVAERLEVLTPEERERFRQRMRERWGFGPSTGESKGQ